MGEITQASPAAISVCVVNTEQCLMVQQQGTFC